MNKLSAAKVGLISVPISLFGCGGSGGDSSTVANPEPLPETFALNFKVVNDGVDVNCDNAATGVGPDAAYSVGISDMRFYVSNLKFYDINGVEIDTALDDNDFQLNHENGPVSLIDFTGTDSGFCTVAQEGTPRTNTQITGEISDPAIASVSFDVGVPQSVMKSVIAATDDVTDTPSPLGEMYWSWASGYRHFVINFTSMDSVHTDMFENSGFHIGSRDCGTGGEAKALSDRDSCGLVNTPSVMIENFDPALDTITVDLQSVFSNVQASDFVSDAWSEFGADESICIDERRNGNWCVTGQSFGIQCHSGTTQSSCISLFPNFGLTIADGTAEAASNVVFGKE